MLGTVAGLKRFVTMHESPYHGLNFCQGTVAEMLDDPSRETLDVIRWSARRVAGCERLAVAAAVLAIAGLCQFSALKYRCLDKCRSPFGFVVEHWRGSREKWQSLLLGVRHGAFCVGCCWSLMLLMFVVGTGSIGWMPAAIPVPQSRRMIARRAGKRIRRRRSPAPSLSPAFSLPASLPQQDRAEERKCLILKAEPRDFAGRREILPAVREGLTSASVALSRACLALGAVMAAEKHLPGGRRLAAPTGAVLLLAALWVGLAGATA